MSRKYCILLLLFILLIPGIASVSMGESETDDYLFSATIAQNGHFLSHKMYLDVGDELTVKVSVIDGEEIDVYIMTSNQYDLAYNVENESIKSIGYLYGEENRKEFEFTYEVPDIDKKDGDDYYYYDNFFDGVFIVVDNRNCSLTENDADSIGIVYAKIDYTVKYVYSDEMESFDDINLMCGISIIIIIVIVIIIIFYFVRESRRSTKQVLDSQTPLQTTEFQNQYQYQYQYQPHYPPLQHYQYYQHYPQYHYPPPQQPASIPAQQPPHVQPLAPAQTPAPQTQHPPPPFSPPPQQPYAPQYYQQYHSWPPTNHPYSAPPTTPTANEPLKKKRKGKSKGKSMKKGLKKKKTNEK